jgi:DNA-binding response OmpR family regulator
VPKASGKPNLTPAVGIFSLAGSPEMEKPNEKKDNIYRFPKNDHGGNSSSILLAEDDEEMRKLLALMLRKEGYRVCECMDGLSLLDMLSPYFLPGQEHEDVDLIISDIRMPGVTGLEILMGANELDDFPPIILITAFGDKEIHVQAKRLGAAALFDKPFDLDELMKKVAEILSSPSSPGSMP